ncbi:Adenylate kinase isoenzyme 5 [Mactra antiquata]
MTTEDAKTYLSKRDIPRLFESLMTGLMYHRPQDHIKYLIDCLQKVHDKGQENITWSSFVDIRRTKTPLPPISNGNSRPASKTSRPSSKTRAPKEDAILTVNIGNIEDSIVNRVLSPDEGVSVIPGQSSPSPVPHEDNAAVFCNKQEEKPSEKTSSPLPAIPTSTTSTTERINLPDIPIVVVMGSPGSGKDVIVENLLQNYPGWKHFNVNKLIKLEIQRRGDAHAKWKMTRDVMSRGEVAPEDVSLEMLLEGLKTMSSSAKGLVITGFPRNMEQAGDYTRFVSRLDVVFMIDCDEAKTMDKLLRKARTSTKPEHSMSAITTKMNYFKANTLAVAKFYDDQGKLVVIDADKSEEQTRFDFCTAFDELFFSKYGTKRAEAPRPASKSSLPDAAMYKKKNEREESFFEEEPVKPLFVGAVPQPPVISEQDTGRKPGLPTAPIIFVAGGPGSGKGTQCKKIISRYQDFVHLSMGDIIRTEISDKGTADDKWGMITQLMSKGEMAPEDVTIDLLKAQLNKHSSAKAFIIEGFPRDKNQVESFNKNIGGLNFVILFDCEEYYMQMRLLKRGRDSGRVDDNPTAISNRLNFYKYNTIPVMKYFDDAGKLVVLDADRDIDTMFFEISQMFDFAFFGRKPGQEDKDKKEESQTAPVQEEVIEASISQETANTTGDTVENPEHSKKLDEAANS